MFDFSFPISNNQGTLFMLCLTGRGTIHRKYSMNGASWSCALPGMELELRAQKMLLNM